MIALLEARRSIRQFSDRPVAPELVRDLVEAGMRAPTSDGLQAYSIVSVERGPRRSELARLAEGQAHVEESPVFLALCGDLHRASAACCLHGVDLDADTLEMGLVAAVDAALVGMSISLAAEAAGLGSVMVGAMRSQADVVARVLGLPPRVFVVFGMCVGWPGQLPARRPRLPADAVFFEEQYDRQAAVGALPAFDRAVAAHYRRQGRQTGDASWTSRVAERFQIARARRPDLRSALLRLGLPFH